ncbi:TetR/AcrR family transcriptional regulator [Stenotrophomonas sp. 24(2023)]|uniref:TetR/AcrR family transcriptional regulator n=1 Tax=Stenotrophomonas sp. 24(2023) TaxID=3068324 RepID=UPI0027E1CD63|nr:TetR/AcrR family transcriptional regulator [Stenotrophomonas sp. 24(2023)]WMJ69639.1 TetR/AcrR family transcriptional regulator [Stenotrophomonas sp. 24(2023)]
MTRTGRPRSFDRDTALEQAMQVFWARGYEAASLALLKDAMGGISSPSFYAAFGSKEALFEEVLQCYLATHGQVMAPLYQPGLDPRAAVERALHATARMQTDSGHPLGCLLNVAATTTPDEVETAQALLAGDRAATRAGFIECARRAVSNGQLPATSDAQAIGVMLDTFMRGLTAQARDGVPRAQMDAAIDALLAPWKKTTPRRGSPGPS